MPCIERQRGFTLFGVAIALILALAVTVAALQMVPTIQDNRRANELLVEVAAVNAAVDQVFGGGRLYNAYGNSAADMMEALRPHLPVTYHGSGAQFTTPISGAIMVVKPTTWGGGPGAVPGDAYSINLWGVPQDQCVGVARTLAGAGGRVQINTSVVYQEPNPAFDLAGAVDACARGGVIRSTNT